MKSNTEQLKIAAKYLGDGCRTCCSMANNCCCYFVSKTFKEAGNASLFYGGYTVTYCPNAIKWCKNNLAQIPPFLAMPSDIIFFDWELNGTPNHIGFVDKRISNDQVHTLEGNTTSKYVVAYRTREAKYIQGIFRPHFKPTSIDTSKALAIDGQFDYNSIAMLQKALGIKVDGILGKDTVKTLQKKVGVTQDGSWGKGTSKGVQTFLKKGGYYTGKIDGEVYLETVKALQRWINASVGKTTTEPTKVPQTDSKPSSTPSVAKDDSKLTVNGVMEKKSVERMQEFFGTTKDGIISGQKEALWKKHFPSFLKSVIGFSGKGSECVKKLQKWLGVTQDGILGEKTIKAWQKKLGVTQDGCFGEKSAKAWQKYLNENEKAVYPTVTKTQTTTTTTAKQTKASQINATALKFAWAAGTKKSIYQYPKGRPTTAFIEAWKKYFPKAKMNCGCHQFVNLVLKACGYKGFGGYVWTKNIIPYLKKNFTEIPVNYKQSQLKPGDIRVHQNAKGGYHIWIIVEKNGKMYRAEANQVGDKRYAHLNASTSGNTKKHKKDWLFRAK